MINESEEPLGKAQKYTHYYYQGILSEIGTFNKYDVYIPSQDKNRPYLDKTLKDVSTLERLPMFTYDHIINTIKSIDVIWMNNRGFPDTIFEVENSTNFKNSLSKFFELRDFFTDMIMVSYKEKYPEFKSVMSLSIYKDLIPRVSFYDYEYLESYFSKPFQFKQFKRLQKFLADY